MKLSHVLLTVVAFLCSFLGAAAALGRLVPWPDREQLAIKRDDFGAVKDEVELLVVGSSRVLRGFVPEEFDRECAARGFEVRSYNFGVGGAHELESDRIVRGLLALRPARLRYVLLEYQRPQPYRIGLSSRLSDRSVFWHTPRQFLTACRHVFAVDAPFVRQLEQVWHHLLPTLAHVTGYGRVRDVFVRRFSDEPRRHAMMRERLVGGRGYEPVITRADRLRMEGDWRKIDETGVRELARKLERWNAIDRELVDDSHLEALARDVEAAGARLLLVVMPGESPTPELYRRSEPIPLPAPLLGFNRPHLFAELYALESRYNDRYLSESGAVRFTRLLAERFVRVVGER
ncbi:MAG: hypothetical protein ACF8XB_00855 [Planctomycetota bacterium JB042]